VTLEDRHAMGGKALSTGSAGQSNCMESLSTGMKALKIEGSCHPAPMIPSRPGGRPERPSWLTGGVQDESGNNYQNGVLPRLEHFAEKRWIAVWNKIVVIITDI
jgi:hypothetical protein